MPAALARALLDGALRAACLEGGRSSLTLMVLRSQRDEPRSKHQGETTMEHYAGIDVSLECSSVCVVDGNGKIVREGKVPSEPDALINWLRSLGYELNRIGLEAGPLSQWRFAVMRAEFTAFEKQTRRMVRSDMQARLLTSVPAVGPIVALTYASAVDDPARFKSSKQAGAHFGLTPKKHQSGETDYTGRISKIGDASVRTALYEAAHVMLTKPLKGCSQLKSWAMRIARRAGMSKAKVALARRLAVIMHRMLADGTPFNAAAPTA